MPDGEAGSPIVVRHPSPAASLPARGRTPTPFFEALSTPARLERHDPSGFVPAGDPVDSGYAHALRAGQAWRSLSAQSYPGGPRTGIDAAEFAAFLAHDAKVSALAPLLRHTPLVASRPLPVRPGKPPFEVARGGTLPDGHRLVSQERERSEGQLRAFLRDEIAATGERVYRRVHPAVAVGAAVTLTLAPDPGADQCFLLPLDGFADAVRATLGRAPTRAERARVDRLADLGGDEASVLRESVNVFARSTLRFLDGLRWDPADPPGLRARIRERIGAHGDGWRARAMIGAIDPSEGEILVGDVAAAEADIWALGSQRSLDRPGFAALASLAGLLLLPSLRRGRAPTGDDLAALSAI